MLVLKDVKLTQCPVVSSHALILKHKAKHGYITQIRLFVCFVKQLKEPLLGNISVFSFVFQCPYMRGHLHVIQKELLLCFLMDCLSAHDTQLFSASGDISNELQLSVARWKIQQQCTAALKLPRFTKSYYYYYEKKEKAPKNYTMAKLCTAHNINVTAWRLSPLNATATVCFTQYSQLHPITRSLVPLLAFNIKAPHPHTLSVFYHRKLNSYIQPFSALLIVHLTKGKIIVQI